MDEELQQSLLKLPLRHRVSFSGEIWDSLPDADVPTPPALRKKLRARLAAYRANPADVLTLEQFREKSRQLLDPLSTGPSKERRK